MKILVGRIQRKPVSNISSITNSSADKFWLKFSSKKVLLLFFVWDTFNDGGAKVYHHSHARIRAEMLFYAFAIMYELFKIFKLLLNATIFSSSLSVRLILINLTTLSEEFFRCLNDFFFVVVWEKSYIK